MKHLDNLLKGLTEEQKKDSLEKISKELIKYLAKK